MDTLARKNPHPRDAAISFDEGEHLYTIAHDPRSYISVTTLNKHVFRQFDAPAVAANLVKKSAAKNDPSYKYFGQTAQEILDQWEANRVDASSRGTAMHLNIERFFNGQPIETDSVEFSYFRNFWRDFGCRQWTRAHRPGDYRLFFDDAAEASADSAAPSAPDRSAQWADEFRENDRQALDSLSSQTGGRFARIDEIPLVPYRAEWCVYSEDHLLAGSIDMLFENPDGTLQIYDWKRCKGDLRPEQENEAFPKFAIIPGLESLPDNDFWHYAIQLNQYKNILETKYGKKVVALYLICMHPNHDDYLRVRLPFLPEVVGSILAFRKQWIEEGVLPSAKNRVAAAADLEVITPEEEENCVAGCVF